MRGLLITLLLIIVLVIPAPLSALPYSSLVSITRSASFEEELNPLGEPVSSKVTVKITVHNNFTYPITVNVWDLEEKVRVTEFSAELVSRESLAPGYELLYWRVRVPPSESEEISLTGTPLEEFPLRVEVYYYVNDEPAYPYRKGGVWKLKVEVGDRFKVAIKLVNELPRFFDGKSYVKVPISALVTIPFPDDVLELEDSNLEPSRLMANSWILTVTREEWLNVTYRVESLGAWGEVNLDPISITYSPFQRVGGFVAPSQAGEAERMAETLSILKDTLASMREGVQGTAQMLSLIADSMEFTSVQPVGGPEGYKLSEALRRYSEFISGLSEAVKSMSKRAKRSSDLLVEVIASIDPTLLVNPTPELRELMYQLSALTYGLSAISGQLETAGSTLREMSEGVEGLENATESLTETLTTISEQMEELSQQLKAASEQMKALGEGLLQVEQVLDTLSETYGETARALRGQEKIQSFLEEFYTSSRAWGSLDLGGSSPAVGYELTKEGSGWVLDNIRLRGDRECLVTWLKVEVEEGRISGLRFENNPENLTSIRVELLDEGRVLLVPVFSRPGGYVSHPLAGKFSVTIESSVKPVVSVTPVCSYAGDYVTVKSQEVSYTVSVEMPILSREKPPELPFIPTPEKRRKAEYLYLVAIALVVVAAVWYIRKLTKKGVEHAELSEIEREMDEIERELAAGED